MILDAIEAGRQITVHGDYDVDGVCSTAILVAALRDLGGRCDWYVPSGWMTATASRPPASSAWPTAEPG